MKVYITWNDHVWRICIFSFTPSKSGSESSSDGRMVPHFTGEGDPCIQRLWRENKDAEEGNFPAVVVHHLETFWLVCRHGVHRPIWRQQGSVSLVFRQFTVRVEARKGATGDWQVIDMNCSALVSPGEVELVGVEAPSDTEKTPLTSLRIWGDLKVNSGRRRWR